ncbi:unnamed protein product, partial [Chrysoparadoxa australica]
VPHETDFLSDTGTFDIGVRGSKVFHNSLVYKMCYYRFAEMQIEPGKPGGYDRVRKEVVGVKDIKLSTIQEAFTSEHWIVRIYKVLPRPVVDPSGESIASLSEREQGASKFSGAETAYLGCYSSERFFGGKEYSGGSNGASFSLIHHHTLNLGKKYFAVARNGIDGHAFSFDYLEPSAPRAGDMSGGGCERPCADFPDK